jgi:RNA polymerase sigma-70 factor, ECF subfamily
LTVGVARQARFGGGAAGSAGGCDVMTKFGTARASDASNYQVVREVPLGLDPGLIAAASSGDEAAFDALVGPLIEPGFRLAVVMLRDREEARDAVQEACVLAWRRLSQLRDEAQLRPWFLSIVANRCRTVRRTRWWSIPKLPAVRLGYEDPRTDVESQIDLDRELHRLPTRQRMALFLFFYSDLPLVDVAAILKVSPQAAKSLVHRAVVKLRLSMVEVAK